MSWFDEGGSGSSVDVVALMDADPIQTHLWDIVAAGALVSVGRTSDGGAVGVTITMDGRWRREYFRESEELAAWLIAGLEAVRQEAVRLAASSAPRQRRRSPQRGL